VVRKDMQRGRTASGVDVQLHCSGQRQRRLWNCASATRKRVPRCEAARTCRPLPACRRLRGFATPCGVIPACAVCRCWLLPCAYHIPGECIHACKESSPGKVTGIVAAQAHVASLRSP
jgi:hypothetical protein